MAKSKISQLPNALLPWYQTCKRDLPWRRDQHPYHVWLSEIMLQQTRVEAVIGYYNLFLEALPDIASLAACDDDLLFKLWEGLGYYSRVRNLKKAAQIIMKQFNGEFPVAYDGILSLPGIGEYTAGAISSIAFNLPYAAVDGNVLRVVARITDDDQPIDHPAYKKQVKEMLEAVYPKEAGAFTQALMELGATVCGPNRAPDCAACPCRDFCGAVAAGRENHLPIKSPRKEKKQEEKTVFILSCNGQYALCKRSDAGLLAGMWQFPNSVGRHSVEEAIEILTDQGIAVTEIYKSLEREHVFTHIRWTMRGYYLEVKEISPQFDWFTEEQIQSGIALPTAFRKFWDLRGGN